MDEQSKKPLQKSNETEPNEEKDLFKRSFKLKGKELEKEMKIMDHIMRKCKAMTIREQNSQNQDPDIYIL